ncbi:hypothetical protein TNCV_5086141 [Trichonephila clavipes]|uniref:Uncharacterized protein n=1 Tax=Trichonephila clavipes TaxID=2585209 RepID=A0A8X6VCD6_TRICX|nr:hypothetical protein TNCV_5086141 [Trichonephila clavipes]
MNPSESGIRIESYQSKEFPEQRGHRSIAVRIDAKGLFSHISRLRFLNSTVLEMPHFDGLFRVFMPQFENKLLETFSTTHHQ